MESSIAVDTGSGILARVVVQALIDVDGAISAGEASTLANGSGCSFLAHSTVVTRIGVAEAAIVTSLSTQFRRAFAMIVVAQVNTLGFEETGARCARVLVVLAMSTREPGRAGAGVAPLFGQSF